MAPNLYRVTLVRLSDPESRSGFTPRFSKEMRLDQGESREVILGDDLGPHSLRGRVLVEGAPCAGVHIELIPQFDWGYSAIHATSDKNGKFIVEGLRGGAYSAILRIEGASGTPGRSWKERLSLDRSRSYDFEWSRIQNRH